MAVEVAQDTMNKLMHHSEEIRTRAFNQIEAKLVRSSTHNLSIHFNAAELWKALIRMLKHYPSPDLNARVLKLLKSVLSSTKGVEIVQVFGISCLKSELYEIKRALLEKPLELQIVAEIDLVLSSIGICSEDFSQLNTSLNSLLDTLSVDIRKENLTELFNFEPDDFEVSWSNPKMAEYETLKDICNMLSDEHSSSKEKENVLFHLQNTMTDYSAEHMLQSPNLFAILLRLYGNPQGRGETIRRTIFTTLLSYVKALIERLIQRGKVDSFSSKKIRAPKNSLGQKKQLLKTQLKVSKAMELLLEKCFEEFETELLCVRKEVIIAVEIVTDILKIFKIQKICFRSKFLTRIDKIRLDLQDVCSKGECYDSREVSIAKTKHIWLTHILIEMAELSAKCSQLTDQYKLIAPQLIDFGLQLNYPSLLNRLKKLVFNADVTIEESYKKIQILREQFETAVKIIIEDYENISKVILKAVNIVPILDAMNSVALIEKILISILKSIPSFLSDFHLKDRALLLLRNLVGLTSVNLKSFVYKTIAKSVKSHFAALMNNESIFSGIQNQQLLSAGVIGIPMDKNLLQQTMSDSFDSECPDLRKASEAIILLQIKSYHFYGSSLSKYHDIFSPLLPMLECCTHSPPIVDALLKLLEPESKQFPFIDVLRGNIGFLFVHDNTLRNEALTRLIFMLMSIPQTEDYLPNVHKISDVLPNDLCICHHPRSFGYNCTPSRNYCDLDALQNLLKLLDSNNTGSEVRKTALLQLNVLCKNWDYVAAFCNEQAHYLILSVLENSLKKDSSAHYIENVIPAISIMTKLLMYDKNFRQKLEYIPNVYMLLLLAVFQFWKDEQLREDASICLFLLVFGSFMVISTESGDIEAPKLMKNMNVPFKCIYNNISSDYHPYLEIISDDFQVFQSSKNDWKNYIREAIAYSYFKSTNFSKHDLAEMRANLKISRLFLIEEREAQFVRATSFSHNMSSIMKNISNATNEETVVISTATLRLYLTIYYLRSNTFTQQPLEMPNECFIVLKKYLQVRPGNMAYSEVYSWVLDIFYQCMNLSLFSVTQNLKNMFRKDFTHCLIMGLKNPELPMDYFLQLIKFHRVLLEASTEKENGTNHIFRANLLEFVHGTIIHFYTVRNLQRIRALLNISKSLTNSRLDLSDQTLNKYSKTFIKLSINVIASTHAFAQWHIDCLINFIQISNQLTDVMKIRLPDFYFNHIVALCGHNNMEVRALSWTCLSFLAKSGFDNAKNVFVPGTHLIASKLSHLPGGFINCCLYTFLDEEEAVLVRNLAGNVFLLFLKETLYFEEAVELLEKQSSLTTVYFTLEACMLNSIIRLPNSFLTTTEDVIAYGDDIKIITSETVICLCRICITLLSLRPDFIVEFREQPLLSKIFELIQVPIFTCNKSKYEMCTEICHLCALCSKIDFTFLQRSVCHDDRWLSYLFALLDPPCDATEESITCVIQLILALCRDEFVYERLIEFLKNHLVMLKNLVHNEIIVSKIGSSLQRCTIGLIVHLVTRSQSKEEKYSFISVLEQEIAAPKNNLETQHDAEISKQNICVEQNLRITEKTFKKMENDPSKSNIFLSEIIAQGLLTVFFQLFSCNSFKFDEPPGASRVQVCEALSLILKFSSNARIVAQNKKLLQKILLIFEKFFANNDIKFNKRYGERKKQSIIANFKMLFQILLLWHSPTAAVLTDELRCLEISNLIQKCWAWIEHSLQFKVLVFKLCCFLSEKSFPFCVQFCTRISLHSQPILSLVFKIVMTETLKSNINISTHQNIITMGLRIMMNCCACTEGRSILVKLNAFNALEGLYPFVKNSPKLHIDVLHSWFQFCELFSRYNEGGQALNLHTLCTVINRSTPLSKTRILCLKILRNFCFFERNRSLLSASDDFLYTVNEIINRPLTIDFPDPVSYDEKIIISVAIWHLVSGGIKFVSMIRGTKLEKSLRELHEKLLVFKEEEPTQFLKIPSACKLNHIMKIIVHIFNQHQ